MTMKPLLVSLAVALGTVALPALGASAQTAPASIVQQFDTAAALTAPAALDLSARVHDDWAVALAPVAMPLDLSLRSHDDWALPAPAAPSLDLSPRSHDDWAVASAS
jgi:hypothetical protein